MARKKPKELPAKCCARCRSWAGKRAYWEDVGDVRGTCLWLVNLAVGETRGVPNWVVEARPVRMTYDDDGADCPAFDPAENSARSPSEASAGNPATDEPNPSSPKLGEDE